MNELKDAKGKKMTVKELRSQLGWTQTELAIEAGVSLQTIFRLENGGPVLKSTIKLVAQALKVQTGEISGVNVVNRVLRRSEQ